MEITKKDPNEIMEAITDPRPSYYKNIDIEKDLEQKDFTFQRLGKDEITYWILDKRTNRSL